MTETQNIAEIIQLGIALLSVWILFFKLFRTYRTDALRDRLFAVRQELFDYADGGGVGFDEPAYTKLRGLLNSLIRFAHHLTFTRFLLGLVWACWGDSDFKKQPIERWRLAMSKLPPESSGRLDEIHTGAVVLVVRHLTTGSPAHAQRSGSVHALVGDPWRNAVFPQAACGEASRPRLSPGTSCHG